jgi:hypothetical protein
MGSVQRGMVVAERRGMKRARQIGCVGLVLCAGWLFGCGGDGFAEDSGSGGSSGAAGAAGEPGDSGVGRQPPAEVRVILIATTSSFPHDDQLSGQTAQAVTAGVRRLELIDEEGGSWLLMDESPGNRIVSYDDAARTELARFPAAQVRPGRYVKGRLVQDWSRFDVTATLHELTESTPGTLHVFQVTSDGASYDGKTYDAGTYEHEFVASGEATTYQGTLEMPASASTAEAQAFVEDGDWVVYFPIDLHVEKPSGGAIEVEVNMHDAFRWTDVPSLVNEAGVYDIAPPVYEPVRQFGGNRFTVRWVP